MVHPPFRGITCCPSMAACAFIGVDKFVGRPCFGIDIRSRVTSGSDKVAKLCIGNKSPGDPVGAYFDYLTIPFTIVPTPFARSAVAINGFVQTVRRLPFGLIGSRNKSASRNGYGCGFFYTGQRLEGKKTPPWSRQ